MPTCKECYKKYDNILPYGTLGLHNQYCSRECLNAAWDRDEAWAVAQAEEDKIPLQYQVVMRDDNEDGLWCKHDVVKSGFASYKEAEEWMMESLKHGELEGCFLNEVLIEAYKDLPELTSTEPSKPGVSDR